MSRFYPKNVINRGRFKKGNIPIVTNGMLGKRHSMEAKRRVSLSKSGIKRPPFSEEWKRNIGIAHRGLQPMLGKKHSEESKIKMRAAILIRRNKNGYINSKEARRKVSDSKIGVKRSEETKKKISLSRMGFKPSEQTRRKMSESLKGNKCYNWKGGITPLNIQIRKSLEYKIWQITVFRNNGYACIWCGSKKKIEADHIKAFCLILKENNIHSIEDALKCEELWNINNGRTLCHECHKKTQNYGNKKI